MDGCIETRQGKRIAKVECIGAEKRTTPNRHFVYVLHVSWSDGVKHPVYRTHSTFFDLKACLLEEFRNRPDIHPHIPELPALNQFEKKGIFAFRENAAERRKKDVQSFCSKILELPGDVLSSNTVTSFFETWYSDFAQLPPTSTMSLSHSPKSHRKISPGSSLTSIFENFKNKRLSHGAPSTEHGKDSGQYRRSLNLDNKHQKDKEDDYHTLWSAISSPPTTTRQNHSLPQGSQLYEEVGYETINYISSTSSTTSKTQSLPRGVRLSEEDEVQICPQPHRATCDYTRRNPGEVDLKVGTIVDVLECSHSGWWFVTVEGSQEQGWAPGAFLDPIHGTASNSKLITEEKEGVYFMMCDYIARNPDEISCRRSEEVRVVQKSLDGWWKVRCGESEGFIPAMHLEKAARTEDGRKNLTASNLFHRKSMYQRGLPPRKSQRLPSGRLASDSSMEVPIYSEIPWQDQDQSERSLESPVPLSSSAPELDTPPLYAQVNKVRKANSCDVLQQDLDSRPVAFTEDGLRYTTVIFDDSSPAVPPKQGGVEYAEISLQNPSPTHSDEESGHYDNSPSVQLAEFSFPHNPDLPPQQSPRSPKPRQLPPELEAEALRQTRTKDSRVLHTYENTQVNIRNHGYENFTPQDLQDMKPIPPALPKRRTGSDETTSHSNHKSASGASPSASSEQLSEHCDWLVGKMSRSQCEDLLVKQGQQCDFLIRESTNRVGDYTLSVCYETRVRHFPIKMTSSHKYYIGKHHFKDLAKVVQYYQKHPLFYDNDKAVELGNPVQR